MPPKKRVMSAEERERRAAYQRQYRAQKSLSKEWRARESRRRMVSYKIFLKFSSMFKFNIKFCSQ
jgi:hypothetical protein